VKSIAKKADASEIETLRLRLNEAEEALQAISKGTIDALVVGGPKGPQVSTLAGAQEPYRLVVERMHEGALTLGEDQQILYSNRHLADLLGYPDGQLIGKPVASFVAPADTAILAGLLAEGAQLPVSGELRFRRQDGSLMPALVAVGSLIVDQLPALLLIITDLTAQKRAEELAASERFALSILEQATDAVIVCDAEGRITKASLAAARLLDKALEGKLLAEAIPMEVALPAEAHLSGVRMSSSELLELVLQRQSLQGAEAQICLPAIHEKHFLLSAGPLSDLGGRVGCILSLTEITDRKRAESQQTMLVAELNHRVKNILAIVQSVAWQTLSANQSPPEFKRAFDGRLRALSLAHDILTQGRWGQVDFEQLVERSLAPYHAGDRGMRAQWSGSRLSLPPNMVVPLSMVLHELSTNAAKYGAFSAEHGRVKIAWRTDGANVRFTWIETNGPPVKREIKAGFGSKLISRVVSYDLLGTADLDFDREGFRCTLTFPVPQLRTDALRPLSAAEPSSVH
jgi:PAS domain S-box-containing protein